MLPAMMWNVLATELIFHRSASNYRPATKMTKLITLHLMLIPSQGMNYYRIKAQETTGKIVYSKILSVNIGSSNQSLRLYPNPVKGNQITISMSNIKRGQYTLRVINTAGQDIFRQVINNQSSSLTQTLDLPATIKAGVYNLLINGDNYRETKTFIVQ